MKYFNAILSIGVVICSTYSISHGYASECIEHFNPSNDIFTHDKKAPAVPDLSRKIIDENDTKSPSSELYRKAFNEGRIDIKGKHYRIHLNESLLIALKQDNDNIIKTNFVATLNKLSQRTPGNRIQGYSFSFCHETIDVTPFLGLNAK